jgi:O-antigen ligase
VIPFALGGGTVGGLAAAHGGYFPATWGWASLALLWLAAAGLVVRPQIRIGWPELLLAGSLLALLCWSAASLLWSGTATATVAELQRLPVYVSAALAAVCVVRRHAVPSLLAGILLGVTAVSAYALATRLFPEAIGAPGDGDNYRLAEPLGYWNALGIFAVLGMLLAIGFAARVTRPPFRALAGASVAILAPTFFFTFSRGAWLALGLGVAAMLVLDARRVQLTLTLLALSPAAVLTVWLGSRADALTGADAVLADAAREGRRLALYVGLLAIVTIGLVLALAAAERRIRVGKAVRTGYVCGLLVLVAVGLGLGFARYGSPASLAERAWEQVQAPPTAVEGALTGRLFDLSSNGRLELARAALDDFGENAVVGSGAGTFERYWLEHRDAALKVRDAHSLYLETLAELGVIGLLLLVAGLVAPIVAAIKTRRAPLVSATLGAYVAYLVHAGVDWDWEMPAVTVAALFCGLALAVGARGLGQPVLAPRSVRIATLTLIAGIAAFTAIGLVGNIALARGEAALDDGRYGAALREAERARRWAPWSAEPWRLRGETQLELGDTGGARASLRAAVEKDPGNWDLWLTLALAADGAEQRRALDTAERLNPLSAEIREIRAAIAGGDSV